MFGTDNIEDKSVIQPSPRVKGCKIIKVAKGDYNGQMTLDITFQDSTGAKLVHREFDPSEKRAEDSQEKFEQKISWVMGRFKHILGRFMSEAEATIPQQPSWALFVKEAGSRLKRHAMNVECDLHVVYKGKYPALPMFPDFISTEAYPKEWKTDPDYHKYEIEGEEGATSTPSQSSGGSDIEDPFGEEEENQVDSNETATPEAAPSNDVPEDDDF